MSIKIDLHDNTSHVSLKPKSNKPVEIETSSADNTSQVRVKPKSSKPVEIETGSAIYISILETLIRQEISDRIAADQNLQDQINSITLEAARYLLLNEKENGSIEISILNDEEEVLDTKLITITEKIIKSAEFDEEHGKIIYTCNDDSTIELDISSLVDDIEDLIYKVSNIETEITTINQSLSIMDTRLDNQELTLSTLVNTTIPGIEDNINQLSLSLSEAQDDIAGINDHLEIVDADLAAAIAQLSIIDEKKVDKALSGYPNVNPKDMNISDIQKLLLYVNSNGIPSYAKLNELGYSRIRTDADFDKVDNGDLLIEDIK